MKTLRWVPLVASTVFLFTIPYLGVCNIVDTTLVVIVNIKNPHNSLSIKDIRMHWMRRPLNTWETKGFDKKIKPVDLNYTNVYKELFYTQVLKEKKPLEIQTYLHNEEKFHGASPLANFTNDIEIIEYVSKEAGAIGYINASSLNKKALKKIKVVLKLKYQPKKPNL